MDFSLPQFIETAPKIVGPLTWRQFLLIGGAAIIIFFLFFIIKHLLLFLAISIFLAGLALVFAFLKVEGRTIVSVLLNLFTFSFSPKLYVWEKKRMKPKTILKKEKVEIKKEEIEKATILKIGEKSKLGDLSTQIETRTR